MMALNIALRAALSLTALIIIFVGYQVVFQKIKQCQIDRTFRFALAIVISWIGHLIFSAMFFSGQYVMIDHAQAEENGWTVPLVTALLISSGIMHIDNLTNDKGDRIWQFSLVAATLVGMAAYWYIVLWKHV